MNKEIIDDDDEEEEEDDKKEINNDICFICKENINKEKDDIMIDEINENKCHIICIFSSPTNLSLFNSINSNTTNNNNNTITKKCDICDKMETKEIIIPKKKKKEITEKQTKENQLWYCFGCKHNLHFNCVKEMCGNIIYKCPLCPNLPELEEFKKNSMLTIDFSKDIDNANAVSDLLVLIPSNLREAKKRYVKAIPRFTKVSKQICHELQTLRERKGNGNNKYKTLIPLLIESYENILTQLSSTSTNIENPPCVLDYFKVNDIDAYMLLDNVDDDFNQFMESSLISDENRELIINKIIDDPKKRILYGYDELI